MRNNPVSTLDRRASKKPESQQAAKPAQADRVIEIADHDEAMAIAEDVMDRYERVLIALAK
ncbi:hypothetical protein [Jiella mangrovi]|uniref:Uncharacterized protein n=1 Tax=Jiella mangrovi TaxID=2821407 RepID=A0ABS4BNT8_9HYPH|nr:hypothetical protein [Jiella mangrovi]MBP0617824.1 hypothetical protein [Jiella mangrovi]